MRQAAHAFKSNCGHVGAIKLVELCQALEDRDATQLIADTAELLRGLEMEFASVRDALHVLKQEASP
jgi:HPt (histidine-containing phosphotransfer) domain-containing protein